MHFIITHTNYRKTLWYQKGSPVTPGPPVSTPAHITDELLTKPNAVPSQHTLLHSANQINGAFFNTWCPSHKSGRLLFFTAVVIKLLVIFIASKQFSVQFNHEIFKISI